MQPQTNWGFPGFGAAPKDKPKDPARKVHRNTFGVDLPWATGSITVNDETFKDIGIRYKGNGTIGDASHTIKKSLKIDLDHFGGEARFQGLKTINLHCGMGDPSRCRETLGYGLYRAAGVPASRTALAEVWLTVPGKYDKELLGLFTVVEHVNKQFLRTHFGSEKGLLMKPEGQRELEYQGEDWNRYKTQYAPKRDATMDEAKRVIAFAKLVHKADDVEFRKEIRSFLDIDAYLRFLAATAFVANTDSFFVLGHNYYLYLHPKTGKFHFMPWDLDRAFANLPFIGSIKQQMNLSFTHPYGGTHRLTDRLLAMPKVSAQYQSLLKELAATCFAKERMLKEVEAIEAATRELVARDAKAAAARGESASGAGPTAIFNLIKPPPLKTFVDKRTESMTAQLAGKSKGHLPTGAFNMGAMMAGSLLDFLDSDRDEMVSKDEWVAGARKVFAACAKDAQGRVNEKSVTAALHGMLFPAPPKAARPQPRFGLGNFLAGPIVKRADVDKSGNVTLDNLLTAAEKLFDEFDKGKTGKLDESAFGELLIALFPIPNFAPPGEPKNNDKKVVK